MGECCISVRTCTADPRWPFVTAHMSVQLPCTCLIASVVREGHSYSATMLAALYGNDICLRMLIDKGADINLAVQTGKWTGKTALDIAKERKREGCIKILEAAHKAKEDL